MSFYALAESGIPVVAGTVQKVTLLELQTNENKERSKERTEKISTKFKEDHLLNDGDKPDIDDWSELFQDDQDFMDEFHRACDNADAKEADNDFDPDSYNHYLNMELAIDHREKNIHNSLRQQRDSKTTEVIR